MKANSIDSEPRDDHSDKITYLRPLLLSCWPRLNKANLSCSFENVGVFVGNLNDQPQQVCSLDLDSWKFMNEKYLNAITNFTHVTLLYLYSSIYIKDHVISKASLIESKSLHKIRLLMPRAPFLWKRISFTVINVKHMPWRFGIIAASSENLMILCMKLLFAFTFCL